MRIRATTIGELVDQGTLVINDGHRMESSELVDEGGLPFIRGGDVSEGRIDFEGVDCIDEELRSSFGNKVSQDGDVVITTKGSVGRFAFVRSTYPEFVYSPQLSFWRVKDSSEVLPSYLWQWARSPEFKKQLGMYKGQTTMADYISLEDQRRIEIDLPSLPVQRRIADILGVLDDKIELNRRMNETLEEMAQALYRHWFVDFGPFQDREFKDTEEMGSIPKGWEIKPFLDTCEIETGGTPKTSVDEYWGGDILWASAKDVSQSTDAVLLDPERTVTPAGIENSPADVLPAGTTAIVARGATTGRHAILGRDMALNQSCYGLIGKDGYSWGWTYLTVDSLVKRLRKHAYGSAFDSVTISTFENLDIVGAPPEVISAFKEKVMPLFKKMMANVKENQTLAEIRDYLLPKLISGEIEVDAVQEVAEDVAETAA
jgi:type I restriction enzyme S subunit